jgi:hypothetical protein
MARKPAAATENNEIFPDISLPFTIATQANIRSIRKKTTLSLELPQRHRVLTTPPPLLHSSATAGRNHLKK